MTKVYPITGASRKAWIRQNRALVSVCLDLEKMGKLFKYIVNRLHKARRRHSCHLRQPRRIDAQTAASSPPSPPLPARVPPPTGSRCSRSMRARRRHSAHSARRSPCRGGAPLLSAARGGARDRRALRVHHHGHQGVAPRLEGVRHRRIARLCRDRGQLLDASGATPHQSRASCARRTDTQRTHGSCEELTRRRSRLVAPWLP
jgi:hypothetical protein